jgi:uncharacterized membrane protein (DUF485 family)
MELYILLVLFACFVLYFLPAILASGKENGTAIGFLNLMTGWTFIGWVACFIWACVSPEKNKGVKSCQLKG